MALAPAFKAHRIGPATSLHTLELFLDLNCPFSAKQLKGVEQSLLPALKQKGAEDKLSVIIRQVPQPWHHASTFTHQAALAVAKLSPDSFQTYFSALMARQTDFFDEPTVDETPNQTKDRLASLAEEVTGGKVKKAQVVDLIKTGKGNAGSQVDKDLKLAVRYHRQIGVHVTPTVALDGIIDPSVSSSFTKEDWTKYLDEKVLN